MPRSHPQLLLVSADPILRFTLEEVLTHYGYEVTIEPSIATAQALAKDCRFDLLLMVQPLSRTRLAGKAAALGDLLDDEIWLERAPVEEHPSGPGSVKPGPEGC
jgi:hypothetical protein